jgi:hypothetical protein
MAQKYLGPAKEALLLRFSFDQQEPGPPRVYA